MVWVADFGLAKVIGQQGLTDTGELLGTLRYLAPERLRGRVDRRSDLYALGLTLYELLALRPAFGETDREALIQQLTRSEPPRLVRLDPAVPRDLATIVHKAMARDPADRYQTAGALAADLDRFLEDRPIAARRLGPLGVTWRWCRRNPAVAGLLWLLALLLVGGTIGSSVAAYWYNRLARSERAARQATHEALQLADRHATEAQEVIAFFIDDMIGAATPEKKLGRPVSVDEVLVRADRAIEGKFPGQPLVEASIRHTLGTADQKIGHYDQAERHLLRAVDLRVAILGTEHPETLTTMNERAIVLRDAGRWEEARGLFERVWEARQRVLGVEHPDTLASIGYLALLARDRDDQEQARQLFSHLLEVRRRVLGPEHPSTLGTMNNLAFALRYQGKHDQAGPLIDRVLEAQMRVLGPEHPKTLDALENRGHWLSEGNELDEARTLYERVLHGRQRHYGLDHTDVIEMQRAIANTWASQGNWERATARYQDALAARRHSYMARFDLALLDLRRGDLPGYRDHCAAILRQIGPGVDPRDLAWAARICSLGPGAVDDPTIPLELARRAVETSPASPPFQLARGAAAYRAERFSEAVTWLEKSRAVGIDSRVREQADTFLAMALGRLERRDEARSALAEADQLHAEWERAVASQHGWPGSAWREWVIVEIASREARTTAGQAALPDDVFARP
jgi:tetratricopeptide (TPR) repeat protein